jgi:hypothetical protein
MKTLILSFVFLSLISISAHAQNYKALTGLLEAGLRCNDQIPCDGMINVYKAPSDHAGILAKIKLSDSETWPDNEESGYEIPAIVVFGVKDGWYQVRLQGQEGWIRSDPAYHYFSYPELLKDRMSFISVNGIALRQRPSEDSKIVRRLENEHNGSETPVKILDVMQGRNKDTWIKIETPARSVCDPGDDTPPQRIPVEGWIKAYDDSKPTVWFYSRGC